MSHFNQIANVWDEPDKVKMMRKLAAETKKFLKIKSPIDIMDFGTGTGLFGLEFQEHIKSLIGIDTSEGMLAVFEQKTENFDNIQSLNINLENQTIDNKFDLIISSMAFHHLNFPKDLLMKLKNNLNPHGQVAIVDLDTEDGSFHPDNKKMGVKHFGFSKKEIEEWAKEIDLKLEYYIINTINKNDKVYHQFLAIFKT